MRLGAPSQEQVFSFLSNPATHGSSEAIRRIDTHAAVVFLAGSDVYKVKRAVRFPFLDQSTLEARRRACDKEVQVNRTFTPRLYHGVVPITRDAGGLRIGGSGEPLEWAVHMQRFDENQTLDLVADRGELTPDTIAKVARLILASHERARIDTTAPWALGGVIDETLTELAEAPDVFPAEAVSCLAAAMRKAFADSRALLVERGAAGSVRRCHGDLHLRNIALLDGEPVLFDAIEFDEAIATIDVLYDLAFALMDLCERGLIAEANLLLNRYLWGSQNLERELAGMGALPLFLSLRAAVHAKVDALRFRTASEPAAGDEASHYFGVAQAFLEPAPPGLVAIGGLSGAGKTTVAGRLAPSLGRLPGAVHLRSDIERKRMLGAGEYDRLPETAYTVEVTERVYAALRRQAALALRAGQGVVVDAVHALAEEREAIAAVAAQARVPFVGLWLKAPTARLIERIEARARDASDATAKVVTRQADLPTGPIDWVRLDASGSTEATIDAALAACAPLARPGTRTAQRPL